MSIEITDEMWNEFWQAYHKEARNPSSFTAACTKAALAAVAPMIAAAEREKCALIATDYTTDELSDYQAGLNSAALAIAADIRARSS